MTGSGTKLDPYIIYDVDDLQAIENDLTAYYELANDIDASATVGWNGGLGFDPIGSDYVFSFSGHFDGKGYTISDLFINRPDTDYVGLFATTYAKAEEPGGLVKNVHLTDVNITGERWVGGLIGAAKGSIESCSTTGTVVCTWRIAGGLAGSLAPTYEPWEYLHCTSSWSSCTVNCTGSSYGVGGLIGYANEHISFCYATGDVTAPTTDEVGGLFGNQDGWLDRCYATGNVIGLDSVGGLAGVCAGFGTGVITNCYARGAVTGNKRVGGFTGLFRSGTIDKCYSTGKVTGSELVGGFCGDNDLPGGTITDSFWDTETSEQATSDGGTGKTTAEMKTKTTFTDAGWDFATIWNICSGINSDYPCLIDVTLACFRPVAAPTVSTNPATALSAIAATPNGTLDDDGGEACECGFVWGPDTGYGVTTPTQSKVKDETFSHVIRGLFPDTTYHFRAFATNSAGTSYGADRTFTTKPVISRAYALARRQL